MLDPAYVKSLMANYDPHKATPSAGLQPGKPAGWEKVPVNRPGAPESRETTHFDAVDQDGNAVSTTYTLNGGYGSGVTIPGTGFLMNNEMDDFASKPGSANMFGLVQGEANSIAPHKRPLSSMTPSFVLKDGKLFLATGSPGGPTIINTTLEIITNVIDHGMPAMQAVEAPRFHHQWMPDLIDFEINGLSPDTVAILRGMGHILKPHANFEGAYQGDGETIEIDPASGLRLGASDPRRADGRAIGY
jgi:gamma-glutamyltranspeptidase/glutathione hydrolase